MFAEALGRVRNPPSYYKHVHKTHQNPFKKSIFNGHTKNISLTIKTEQLLKPFHPFQPNLFSTCTNCTDTDLLDERVRRQKGIVLLGKLFDEFLVLVELFEVLHRHVVESDLLSLRDKTPHPHPLPALDVHLEKCHLELEKLGRQDTLDHHR